MPARTLSAFTSSFNIEHLATLVQTVKEKYRARTDEGVDDVRSRRDSARVADDRRQLAETNVLGVREAKDKLPTLLNEATEGEISFVSAGKGGSVVIVGTDALAGALATLEDESAMTFAEAIASLPYKPAQLRALKAPKGRPPHRGWLSAGRA